uniref:Zinc finger MYM-type protein 1-like n=1 Tax=Diabrotica virgifera virgifera TaxID=50390 RepID=A0A6P7G7E9_DIAVI
MKILLGILAVLPVTTASVERSFSTLKRLKTYLRNSIGEERLTSLVLLSIHRGLQVKTEEIIYQYTRTPRRSGDGPSDPPDPPVAPPKANSWLRHWSIWRQAKRIY